MKKQLIGTGICLAILVAAGFFFLQRGGLAAGVQGVLSGEVLLIDAGPVSYTHLSIRSSRGSFFPSATHCRYSRVEFAP